MDTNQDNLSEAKRLFLEALSMQEAADRTGAERNFRAALLLAPGRESILINLSGLLLGQYRFAEAREFCELAVRETAASPEAWFNAALCDLGEQKWVDAEQKFEQVLLRDSRHTAAMLELARLHYSQGRFEKGMSLLSRLHERAPEMPSAWRLQALMLAAVRRFDEALIASEKAAELAPDWPEAQLGLGNALCDTNRSTQALLHYERALQAEPRNAEIHHNIGNVEASMGNFYGAIERYNDALHLNPHSHLSIWNRGLARLALGKLADGFADYEARWLVGHQPPHKMAGPCWSSEDITGKRLLVHPEQGFGDMIMFGRLLQLVVGRGAQVQLAVQPELRELFLNMPGIQSVVSARHEIMPYDFHCPVMSLPRALGLSLADLPMELPYIRVPQERRDKWTRRLSAWTGVRVGLVWSSSEPGPYFVRSMPFEELLPLESVEACFFSLQPELTPADRAACEKKAWPINLGDELHDFVDTAAFIEQLDLVISVDTAVAHLAGALGKTVWVLLPHVADWRWLIDRQDSPWYPSARLFRQPAHGDWRALVGDQLLPALRRFSAERGYRGE